MSAAERVDVGAERAHRRRPALVAGAGVGLWIVASAILNTALTFVSALASSSGLYDLQYLPWLNIAGEIFFVALPVAAVYFLSVWVVRPIHGAQTLRSVIPRSVLAIGLGVIAQFVIGLLVGGFSRALADQSLFGATFPIATIGDVTIWSIQAALSTFVGLLPVGVLAGILLWTWLRSHPATSVATRSETDNGAV